MLVLQPPRASKAEVEEALTAAVRDEAPGRPGRRHRLVLVRAAAARARGARRTPSGSPRGSAPASRARSAIELPAGAGPRRAGRRAAAGVPRGALRARGARAGRRRRELERRGPPLLATYRDLGSFQLLLSLQDDDALRLFCDSILSPIEEGEGAYGGELMRSLESFIECNGQWEKAARQLYCHRHTLRYRIRRVEELTGRSLDSARDRIDFWLALRGRELIN